MGATRIAAIAILWLTAPFYSRMPYGLNVAIEGGTIARHGESYVLAGYMLSATIASALLALVFFRWKWKNDAGFGWLVVLTVSAFGIFLILSAISDFIVTSLVPGLPIEGEDGRVTLYPPQTIPILGQITSAGLYILTFPILFVVLAVIRGLESGLSRVMHKSKKETQQAAPSNGG